MRKCFNTLYLVQEGDLKFWKLDFMLKEDLSRAEIRDFGDAKCNMRRCCQSGIGLSFKYFVQWGL